MKSEGSPLMKKWMFIINRIGKLIAKNGSEIVVINVAVGKDAEEHYKRYMLAVETVKDKPDAVVTAGFPGEERIFWPFHDVQFYIERGGNKISATGNGEMAQRVFNTGA